jgi:predicted porin
MNRKLLPTMIGAVLAGGMTTAASADVTVFGHLDTSFVNFDEEFKENGSKPYFDNQDDTNLVCTTCSIGFKGSEDLGNGLKAIFKLDFQFDTTERNPQKRRVWADTIETFGPSTDFTTKLTKRASVVEDGAITDRDQWLGLAGGFGQVRFGTISTGYKSHGAMIDPLYRTSVQARDVGLQSRFHSGAGEDGQGRATNTIRYDSPNWNGLKVVAHYTLDGDQNDGRFSSTNLKGEEDDDAYGLGASYQNGGILVFADYITNNGDAVDNTRGDIEAWKIGGKYTMNNFSVYGQYEDAETTTGAGISKSDDEEELWHIGGSYTMGNNAIHVAYGQYENDCGTSCDEEYDVFSIVGTHSLSKRTMAYAGYANNDFEGKDGLSREDGEIDWLTLGLKHKF